MLNMTPQTMVPTSSEIAAMTPMMRQYFDLKTACPDAILLFRMGDFFEIFGADAELVAPLLDITLTSRERGDQQRIKFCGMPHHSAKGYWLKLLRYGYKIAIADQMEAASVGKGLVRREITKILTPGCVDDLEGLESTSPNYLMAIYEEPTSKALSLLVADVSTGELRLASVLESEIPGWIETLAPKEILVRRFYQTALQKQLATLQVRTPVLSALPETLLHDTAQQTQLLQRVFPKKPLPTHPCGAVPGGEALVASVLSHVEQMKISLLPFRLIQALRDPESFSLEPIALRDLEIFETLRDRSSQGSLLTQINCCQSPMGVRLLRWSLQNPLLQASSIAKRHEIVRHFLALQPGTFATLQTALKGCGDLERLTARLVAGSATPRQLGVLRDTLRKMAALTSRLHEERSPASEALLQHFGNCIQGAATLEVLEPYLQEEPGPLGEGTKVFRSGIDGTLDAHLHDTLHGEEKVEAYQDKLRAETGITSLKIKRHNTFGLLVEVTKTHFTKIPAHFIRRQTMVNCERFMTEDLQELDEQLSHATRFAIEREAAVYWELLEKLAAQKEALFQTASTMASFDLLLSFAVLAQKKNYTQAKFSPNTLRLRAARHPVVEAFVGISDFVANDIEMSQDGKFLLLTGPNMGGKSTLMRQTAICALLNQIGCFVPAAEATLPLFDQIYTRVGASDDLSRGLSTFMTEMNEAATILRHATSNSLVLLDEVGRGTSTEDGLALAWSIFQELVTQVGAWMFFSTHYHELVPLAGALPRVKLIQTEVLESERGVTFTHRIIPGFCPSSFGLEVASLAGIPERVLLSAREFLQGHKPAPVFAERSFVPAPRPLPVDPRREAVLTKLERLSPNRMTPIQALNVIEELQMMLTQDSHAPLHTPLFSSELPL